VISRTLYWKVLRDLRTGLLVVLTLLVLFEIFWVTVAQRVTTEFSPLFRGISDTLKVPEESFQKHFFSGPGKAAQAIMGGENIRFNKPQDMLAVGYLHPLIQTILAIWAIGRAAGAVAGEIDKGTMELLLAQPITRSQLILTHLVVDLTILPILALSLWVGTMIGAWAAGPFLIQASTFEMFRVSIPIKEGVLEIQPSELFPAVLNIFTLLFAMSGITMAFSALGRARNRVLGVVIILVLIQFAVNLLGQLWATVAFLRPFTIFYYYQPQRIALSGSWWVDANGVELPVLAVLTIVGIAGYCVAWFGFVRRDIPAPL
jgi:ABC-2 type transport system permease protein